MITVRVNAYGDSRFAQEIGTKKLVAQSKT